MPVRSEISLTARVPLVVLTMLAASLVPLALLSHSGDYVLIEGTEVADNPAPAIRALVEGRFGDFVELHPWMGTFSLLLRWPFAALADAFGGGIVAVYKAGVVPCLLVLALLAGAADRLLARRGRRLAVRALVAALILLNPVTFDAIAAGHPEDLLTAALCVGAVLVAADGRPVWAGVLLGLGLATKQWALVAALPVLIAAPAGRVRAFVAAGAVAFVLTLPLLVGNPGRLLEIGREASHPDTVGPANVWAPFAQARHRTYFDGTVTRTATGYLLPDPLLPVPRICILLAPALIGGLWLWKRRRGLEPALGLLALFFLLRCALDPINLEYYYAPFVITLALYETLRRNDLPVLTLLASAAIWVTFVHVTGRAAMTAAWLAWTFPLVALIALSLYAPQRLGRLLSPASPAAGPADPTRAG